MNNQLEDELISIVRKISYRVMNLHKIYSFKLINFNSSSNFEKAQITNVRNKKDIEDSKVLFGNILLRCESLIYYFNQMTTETLLPNGDHNSIKNSTPFDSNLNRTHMKVSRNYLFLFDTIINLIVSLYEYIANCCSYILIGQHARKFKWKKSILEIQKRSFSDLSFCLNQINKEFIDKLSEIRADIFHYNFLRLSSKLSQNIMDSSVEMEFKVDEKIQKFLIDSQLITENSSKVEILNATKIIISKGLENVISILEELKRSVLFMNKDNLKKPSNIGDLFVNAGFKNFYELQQALLYHWGYFWDDIQQFENLDYYQRAMNKMMMPFKFYPEN